MPNLLTVGGPFPQNLDNGATYNTIAATVYLGGTVNVSANSTLNVDPIAAVGLATTFNVSDGASINYDPSVGISALSTFNIGSGGTLALGENVTVGALQQINFTSPSGGPGGTLIVPESALSANVLSTVQGFGVSDALQIDAGANITDVEYSNGSLHFLDAQGTEVSTFQLGLDGDVNPNNFHFTVNGDGSLSIVACYLRGTRISTSRGEVAIEDISIGDLIATVSGMFCPVKWIGRRGYSSTYAIKNPEVQPVLFARGSLADGVPARDLYVSPQHAMYLDGVLVDAELLVNGQTIQRVITGEAIEYFNLEFDAHDVIFAEGAPSESFLNRDCREMFENADQYDSLYPNEQPAEPVFYARRVADGFALAAIRERLAARAAKPIPDAKIGQLAGAIDHADWSRIAGWASDKSNPDSPVALEVLVDNTVIARVMANRYRADLQKAGFGQGRCGFDIELPYPLSPKTAQIIEVRRAADGQSLRGAPLLLAPMPDVSSVAGRLRTVGDEMIRTNGNLDPMLTFLVQSMDAVMKAKAAAEGNGHARRTRFHAKGEVVKVTDRSMVA